MGNVIFDVDRAKSRLEHVDLPPEQVSVVMSELANITEFVANVKVEIEVITPEVAKDYLERFCGLNRTMIQIWIAMYATCMKKAMWDSFNGTTLKFNILGMLIDGQHRLMGVIKSGVPTAFLIIRGLPVRAAKTLDQAGRRTPAALAKISGIEKNHSLIMAAARIVDNYMMGVPFQTKGPTPSWLLTELVGYEYMGLDTSAEFVVESGLKNQLPSPSITAAVHYLIGLYDVDKRDEFFREIVSLSGDHFGSPVYLLRKKLGTIKLTKHANSLEAKHGVFNCWVSLWTSWLKGEQRTGVSTTWKSGQGYKRFAHLKEPTKEVFA